VWGYHFDPGTNLVDVYIRRLRTKIDLEGESPLIETLRGVGYRMMDPDHPETDDEKKK
jgi:two-component system OmpR family response regulator